MKTILVVLLALIIAQPVFSQNTLNNAGLTAASPSQAAFSLRKLSSSYTGSAIKVRRSSDNAEANIGFDAGDNLTATSPAVFTAGVSVGSTLGTVQAGTISADVSKTGTITVQPLKSGFITANNGSSTVTGIGTTFTTDLVVGDRLYNGSTHVFLGVVASITNNTNLTFTNYSTISVTLVSYKTSNAVVIGTGTNFTTQLAIGDRLFTTANVYLGTIGTITSNTSLTVNAADAVAATSSAFKSSTATVTGVGTNFNLLSVGDLLVSNSITLGIVASITNATSLTLTSKAGSAVSGLAYKSTTGNISFSTFYASTSVFLNTWYDQSGYARDAIQLRPANQARIVNAGVLYLVNGRTSMEFSNSLASYVQTSSVASYLNNSLYTFNKVTAEATINPTLQLPISTTGGNGPNNTISHYGYRSSSQFTVAQYGNDQNFNATPSTSLEIHTSVKISTASSQFYKNGISLGVLSSGAPSNLSNVGLLSIGFYSPTVSYYNGSISELIVFSTALPIGDLNLLDDNQLAYYNIATTYWTGAVSTDWNTTGNWSTGILPTISNPSIVVIPSGKPRYPIITGTATANSISLEAGTSMTVNGTLQLAGTINNLGTCTATSGTIQYMGSAPQSIVANCFAGNAVQNIIVNNSTGVTLNANLLISGNLSFTAGNLSLNTATLTLGGTVTNTIPGGLRGSANSSLVVNGTVSPTLSFDQTTPGTTNVLKNLTINSTGQVVTLANNLVLNGTGTTTFTAGKLAIGSSTLTIRGAVVNTVNDGLRGSVNSNVIVDGSLSPVLSFDQTTVGTTNQLSSLTINATGQTVSLNRSLVIGSTLAVTAGTFADGGNQVTSTGTINIGAGTFKLGSASVATTWPAFTTNTIAVGGTAEYAAGVLQTVSATPTYQNLTISATGGTVAANDLTVNGILNLSAANPSSISGSLAMGIRTLNMGASSTTVGQGDVTGIVKRTTILPNVTYTMGNEYSYITFPNTGTLPTQMSMKITIGTAPSWQAGAVKRAYDFIQTGGSGTKAVINAHYLDAELNGNVENKLVDFSYRFAGSVLTEHGKSNFNTTQNWIALSNVNVAFFSSTFGNVELSFDETALTTLTWNGSTSTSWITATNWTPNGGPSTNTVLIVPDASTTPNDPYIPATASNGSLTIESGGIVNADPGSQLTLNNAGLAWSNSGTFNANTSTIIFTNANATINGTTNFNNVTINSGAALLMSSGTVMGIGGTIVNSGTWSPGLLNNTVEYNGNNQTVLVPNGSTQSYNNLIISGTGTTVLPAVPLNVRGNLAINGSISTTGNTIVMNGASDQTIGGTSALTLNNLSIANTAATVNMTQSLSVANTLTLSSGKFGIGSNSLTIAGTVVNSIPNALTGGPGSNLIVNTASSPTLSFDQSTPGISNSLNNLTINSAGQVPALGSDLLISGALNLTAGKLAIGSNSLTLAGTINNTVTGGLRGSASSNLTISAVTSPTLSFDQTTTGVTNLLNNFTLNSPAQTITLGNPLNVNGALGMNGGILTASAVNTLSMGAAATVSGGSDDSFVDGPMLRNTAASGAFLFPVGKNNTYRPVTVNPVSGTAGVFTAEYFPSLPPAAALTSTVSAIATDEYWSVNKLSGPDASITLNYLADNSWSSGNPSSLDAIYVSRLNGGFWNAELGQSIPGNTGVGSTPITSKVFSSLATFTFGFTSYVVLPVTLINFSGSRIGETIKLSWTTANETSFKGFELERSGDAQSFVSLTSLAASNGNGTKSYAWTDASPLAGVNYYRLKMIDIDGHFKYSNVIRFSGNLTRGVSIYPNPVIGNTLNLAMDGQLKGIHALTIFNSYGARVMTGEIRVEGSSTVTALRLNAGLKAGVYFLELVDPQMNRNVLRFTINK